MDKELYELLKKISRRRKEGVDFFKNDEEILKKFDLDLAFSKLNDLGLITYSKNKDSCYGSITCQMTYDGEKAISYGSYEAYLKSLPAQTPLAVHVDQRFQNYGNLSGSNMAVHSQHVNQTVDKASEIEKLFQQIIDALQHDKTLAETRRQELIEDVQSLKAELQRAKPRAGIIKEIYSALGNTASIASYSSQLWEHIKTFPS